MTQAIFKIVNPDEIVCDLGARMTLGQWKLVRKALKDNIQNAASIQLKNVIDELVTLAESKFEAKNTVNDNGETTQEKSCE